VILVASIFFFGFIFELVSRMQSRLERQNRELLALHHAALDISGDLSLDNVLQKVVDQARQLVQARYGAITVVARSGEILEFLTSGISAEQRDKIGPPPQGHGLLGVSLHKGSTLRLQNMKNDPNFQGFPPHHPAMKSLLAVPILCKSPFKGNLYLAERQGRKPFSQEDEETLLRFATAAASAIDNAHLHRQVHTLAVAEERVRLAGEMHDGMAQVLAYVNTKAQAVKEYLNREKTAEASAQLEQLASAAREVYTDVREGILALRTKLGTERPFGDALKEFLERWQDQTGISTTLEVGENLHLSPKLELQLLRIIQEALANVRKHSGAKSAEVIINIGGGRLVAQISDAGDGFDLESMQRSDFPRFGLAIMRERAESLGGTLELTTAPGEGTRVRIEFPLPEEQKRS
ncbi:MAG: GAF domain-containing sensor histidine kinase, partial [Thermoanaerobaculia bacterium]